MKDNPRTPHSKGLEIWNRFGFSELVIMSYVERFGNLRMRTKFISGKFISDILFISRLNIY